MKTIKALSPSSLAKWENQREEFYTRYLSDVRTERSPQINYMAVGSAFDAFVKSQIYSDVFGVSEGSPFDRQMLFEKQVESHLRDEVWEMANFLFEYYRKVGAYNALILDILQSPYAPEMEFKVNCVVNGVPIMGYPDLRYVTKQFVHVIGDWKVNGSYSKHGVSPVQGFKIARNTKQESVHIKYIPKMFKDVEINSNSLNNFDADWATQLTMYAWCLGEEPGNEDYVIRMEQLACRPGGVRNAGLQVKCATHMSQIDGRFQLGVMKRLMDCWTSIQRGHIFTDLTLEESQEHCELIDKKLQTPFGLHPVMNKYLNEKSPRFKCK